MVTDEPPKVKRKSTAASIPVKPRRPKKRLVWSKAFQRAKDAMMEATQLSYPVSGAKLAITTDASDTAIGAVLEQLVKGHWQPLGFFS